MSGRPLLRWDIFCKVIDNYGDIGVCWRLAKQLAHEHGLAVRLWVDDLNSFQRLVPEIDPAQTAQDCRKIAIHHWQNHFVAPLELADAVIEAFGCALPDAYVMAMARQVDAGLPQPAWINLEYLSAEPWVVSHHGLASPHPRLPLTKYFFFPGFTSKTGGLLFEQGLQQRRRAFQADPQARVDFWRKLGLPLPVQDELRISMFAYTRPETEQVFLHLLDQWANSAQPRSLLIAEGVLSMALQRYFGQQPETGSPLQHGSLTVQIFPFLDQDDYDRLLWACDVNFVRGEDSFVRAQWAGRPLVWHIYPQEGGAHQVKLEAFLDLYTQACTPDNADALRSFWRVWNDGPSKKSGGMDWVELEQQLPRLNLDAEAWVDQLGTDDLLTRLLRFLKR